MTERHMTGTACPATYGNESRDDEPSRNGFLLRRGLGRQLAQVSVCLSSLRLSALTV